MKNHKGISHKTMVMYYRIHKSCIKQLRKIDQRRRKMGIITRQHYRIKPYKQAVREATADE